LLHGKELTQNAKEIRGVISEFLFSNGYGNSRHLKEIHYNGNTAVIYPLWP
jgi:hypothetical protein